MRTRKEDLELLHQEWDRGDCNLLRRAQGIFCAVHYQPFNHCLSLIADKLGLRPLYYWEGDKYIIFSTALRILESLAEVPKKMDVRAVTEIARLNVCLSNRTPYIGISRLEAAEIVQFAGGKKSRSKYWSWDQITQSNGSEEEQLQEVYNRFSIAIARRLRNDRSTVSLLSGGLDSRCVTAVLRSHNVTVQTLNFAPPGTQDRVFAAEFAQKIGSIHEQIEMEYDNPYEIVSRWIRNSNASTNKETQTPERPLLVWEGAGGSVGLGHVYMHESIVNLMRREKRDAAIDLYLQRLGIHIPRRAMNRNILSSLVEIPKEGIHRELEGIHCADPARDFYLYLMLHEQRSLTSNYYEDIDVRRLEPHRPFFDSDFLASVLAVPVDLCLSHHFYHRLLKYFPAAVTSVPWQTYPSHEACPLPIPQGLVYQWHTGFDNAQKHSRKREWIQQAHEVLRSHNFPQPIINRNYLRIVTWVYRAGLRDYRYVINNVKIYNKYWVISGGQYELPSNNPIPS
jgi:hypothetical protein